MSIEDEDVLCSGRTIAALMRREAQSIWRTPRHTIVAPGHGIVLVLAARSWRGGGRDKLPALTSDGQRLFLVLQGRLDWVISSSGLTMLGHEASSQNARGSLRWRRFDA